MKKKASYKPLQGTVDGRSLTVQLVDELVSEDGETLCGRCGSNTYEHTIRIELDAGLKGEALLDTVCHEAAHICEHTLGFEIPHPVIHAIASSLTQMFVSTGLIRAGEFEARLRRMSSKR